MLRDRLGDMNLAVSQGAEWAERHDLARRNAPGFTSNQEASAKLLETITAEAEKLDLTIGGKEFLERPRLGPDGLPSRMKRRATSTKPAVKPRSPAFRSRRSSPGCTPCSSRSFIGITRLQINPSGTNKTINAEVEFTQFYHERPAPKVSKVSQS
jgi:hypothetical protein